MALSSPVMPRPVIDDARARAVRARCFEANVVLLGVEEILAAKLKAVADQISAGTASAASLASLELIPPLQEITKEAVSTMKNLTGVIHLQAPLPGEPKHVGAEPTMEEPEALPTLESLDEAMKLRIFSSEPQDRGKQKKAKKPRKPTQKRKTG